VNHVKLNAHKSNSKDDKYLVTAMHAKNDCHTATRLELIPVEAGGTTLIEIIHLCS